MKTLPNEIVLRPRFEVKSESSKNTVLQLFEKAKKKDFTVNQVDEHIFIKFKKEHQHFWSPQLHLEVDEAEDDSSKVYGVFGPNPTLWTFFMFLHFGIGTIFLIFGIWTYSNWSLGKPYGLHLGILILMVLFWVSFYVFGRLGKKKGRPQMKELHLFMREVIKL